MKSTHYAKRRLPVGFRLVATILIPLQFFFSVPTHVWATVMETDAIAPKAVYTPPLPAQVKVNRTQPKVNPPSSSHAFSDQPVDAEFFAAHIFQEPLVPIGGKTGIHENKALSMALLSFSNSGDPEDTTPITDFLIQHPKSAWKASLLTNLGLIYRQSGYWTKALDSWEQAWNLSKNETGKEASQIADRAVAELAELNSRIGRFDRLEKLFVETDARQMHGSAAAKVAMAHNGLWMMLNRPGKSFRCGPFALGRIQKAQNPNAPLNDLIFNSKSSLKGISLDQVDDLANQMGMNYQMAKRNPGAQVIVPSVVNWKVGHYAAIIKELNGRYLIQDPTFTDDIWVSRQALDEESSGYFVVPQGTLPGGWSSVDVTEGKTIWGKGTVGSKTPPPPAGLSPSINGGSCDCHGMAVYDIDPNRINLMLRDNPVGYHPPVGMGVNFTASYSQQDMAAPSSPTFSNMGHLWSCNWISYIIDDPNNTNTSSYGPGGGTLTYGGYNTGTQSFAIQLSSHSTLVRTSASSYEQRYADGSKQVYDLSDGATPKKIYMTKWIDPAGNKLIFSYDSTFRLQTVTDAIGQVTTLSYISDTLGNSGYYLIAKVTDPFGRFASLQYNSNGQLTDITDLIGITSHFNYTTYNSSADFINTLTTPYGITTFVPGGSGINLTLMATDPLGGTEFVQFDDSDAVDDAGSPVPQNVNTDTTLNTVRNTFYWSKEAYMYGAGDKTKAKLMHWLHSSSDSNVVVDILESEKLAFESRVFYNYPGQSTPYIAGISNQSIKVGRVLDDGTTQLYQYDYNSLGKISEIIDPKGRVTTYKYDSNDIDLVAIYQENPLGKSTDSYGKSADLIASYSYNGQHLPLTAIDASGQTTIYTYNGFGQPLTVTNAKNQLTTFVYDAQGYLQTITAAIPGAVTTFTYDGYGRIYTVTDSSGYTVAQTYDAMDRPLVTTYPDATTQQLTYSNLDLEWIQDRLGRKTRNFYDLTRHKVAVEDPLHRVTQYQHCPCGALEAIVDPAGNRTSFIRDEQGRVTAKIFSDGSAIYSTYENSTSRLKTVTDAMRQNTIYTYNIDNTVATISYTNATIPTTGLIYNYDPVYNRVAGLVDATGSTSYSYATITGTATLGAGKLSSVNGPVSNSTIRYGYDELGRVVDRSINGSNNDSQTRFDALGRLSGVTNPLGVFAYNYVAQSGRLNSVNYPNGQSIQYGYYGAVGDNRLQEVKNLDANSNNISQFDYAYNAVGQITAWQQNNSALSAPQTYGLNYDNADQLTDAALSNGTSGVTKSYSYGYDRVGNRIQEQKGSSTTTSTYNILNQLTGQSAGGLTHFSGVLSEGATVTVGGNPALVNSSNHFNGAVTLTTGTNMVPIVATDASGNSKTNNYQVIVPGGTAKSLTYDLNGNMLSDGTRNFQWDAVNRLVKIWYGSVGNSPSTTMNYDGMSRRVGIIERDASGTLTSTKQFIWDGMSIAEERDATNTVTKRFYGQGEQIAGTNYYYTRDHLGSVREMTDSSGNLHARYDYDLYGRLTKLSGDLDADFAFTGHYYHQPSGLFLAPYRAYSADLGRWICRDPIGEEGGLNLYGYVSNSPTRFIDNLGLAPTTNGNVVTDTTMVNCAGYALGDGTYLQPAAGSSWQQAAQQQGFTGGKEVSSADECRNYCGKCKRAALLYLPAGSNGNPFSDPFNGSNMHAMRSDAYSGRWDHITSAQPSSPGITNDSQAISVYPDPATYMNNTYPGQKFRMFCVCKKQ